METRKIVGIIFLVVGLILGFRFSGTRSGFSADDLEALFNGVAYIGGFVLAFIGAVMIFYREREEREV